MLERIALCLVFALMLMLALPRITAAQETDSVVSGTVRNQTLGNEPVSGITVTLHTEAPEGYSFVETESDARGAFRFAVPSVNPAARYGLTVDYQGTLYGQDIDPAALQTPVTVDLTVYDPTSDAAVLSGGVVSVFFSSVDKTTRTVSVLEIAQIRNTSNTTYVPGSQPMNLLRFGLPADATDLTVDTGLAGAGIAQVDQGFALLVSVPPGDHEVLFAYKFPYKGAEYTFEKTVRYGAKQVRVLVPQDEFSIASDQIGTAQVIQIGQGQYNLLEAADIPRDTVLSVRLTGLPQPSLIDLTEHMLATTRYELVGPALLAMFMIGLIAFGIVRRRATLADLPDDEGPRS
jgi:hypothetical protein